MKPSRDYSSNYSYFLLIFLRNIMKLIIILLIANDIFHNN